MKYPLLNQQGKNVGEADLADRVFNVDVNKDLLHQVMLSAQGNSREAVANTKDRGEVRGGGKKPWKQKGTGRARHGSIRSPLWRGGGVTFGPTNDRNFSKKINKKVKQKALFMVLTQKAKDKELILIDSLKIDQPKTKEVAVILKSILHSGKTKKVVKSLIVTSLNDKDLSRAARNISFIQTISPANLNIIDILSNKFLIIAQDALAVIEKTYQKI